MTDYFVRTSYGNDLNDGLSVENGFDTITHAETLTSAGDRVFLCVMATGEKFDREPAYPVSLNSPGSTGAGSIQWSGANSSGNVDGTVAIVDAGNTGNVIDVGAAADWQYFQYISAENGTNGWNLSSGNTIFNIYWRCEAHNNSSSGWNVSPGRQNWIECAASGNGTKGFWSAGSELFYVNCVAWNNGTQGIDGASNLTSNNSIRSVVLSCLSYNTDGSTSQNNGFRKPRIMLNCVSHNNTEDGLELSVSQKGRASLVLDSLFTGNGAWGISDNGASVIFLNNGFHNNTSGEIESDPVTEIIESSSLTLTGSPYQNTANKDFTLNGNRNGLLPRREINQGPWIKKPANLVQNGGFDDGTNWETAVGNWTIANGVAHHADGGFTEMKYSPIVIHDQVLYETIFTIKNYVSGSVRIQVGGSSGIGTSRSANGTYREVLVGDNTVPNLTEQGFVRIIPVPTNFVGDIDDVLVAPYYSGPQGSRGSGGSRMTSYGARGIARPNTRRISIG